MSPRILIAVATLAALAGCGDNQEPEEADDLWTRIHAEGYRDWSRAPGYEMRRQSSAPHGNMVDIYVDPTIAKVLEAGEPLRARLPASEVTHSKGGDP